MMKGNLFSAISTKRAGLFSDSIDNAHTGYFQLTALSQTYAVTTYTCKVLLHGLYLSQLSLFLQKI